MDKTRWDRIQELFHQAAALPQNEQDAFLNAACDDKELIAEVSRMLEQDRADDSLLDKPLAEVALRAIAPASEVKFKPVGPYRVLGLLGEGGMGVVYLAEREDLSARVAVKVLRDAWLSPARRERFASEQKTLAQLNHPSIARLYDAASSEDGTPYFVMEYVDGVPLTRFCRENHCSIESKLKLFRSVCEAVQHAHNHAVIHRDLKPSNILVKSDGSVRLLDFGIAKQIEGLDLPVDQTMTGLRLMTPAYASPEQVHGERVGVSTDVYSLGVILYELLAGKLPFDLSTSTPAEAVEVVTNQQPEKPSAVVERDDADESLSRSAWADLDILCLMAMHKDAERRYRSVEALIRDIDHYLASEPLEARPDSLRYRTTKFVHRNRRAVVAGSLVFVLILALVTFFTIRLARARDAALAEAARTQRVQQFMNNLFEGGDAAAGPSDNLRVVTIVDRGVQQAKALSNDPKIQAELYENLGIIYQKLGKYEQANSLLQSALDQRKKLFGSSSPEVAESLVGLGQLQSDEAHLDQAEVMVKQGLDMDRQLLPERHPAVRKALLAYGKVLAERGSYEEAISNLNEAVKLASLPDVAPTDLATSLSTLADAQYMAGHYETCNSLYRRVLEMHRQLYGDHHPLVAEDLGNLGSIQQDLGYYSEAEKFERQALAITESYYGEDNPNTATDLTMLGRALEYENRFDESVATLQRALAIQEHVFGQVHPSVAETLNELGNVDAMRDNYDGAESYFRKVTSIYRTVYGDHHYLVAIALSNEAYSYMNEKHYAEAERIFREVIRRFNETLGPQNVNTGIAHIKLGRTLLREQHYKDAQQETSAGYEVLSKQTNPGVSYLRAARKDLAAEYEALHQPQVAAKFRAELAAETAHTAAAH